MEHRGTLGGRPEQVAEFAEDMWADDVAFVGDLEDAARAFADIDIEMVAPEIDEHLIELAGRVDGADDLGVLQFRDGDLRTARGFTATGAFNLTPANNLGSG